tara:strand:+ start:4038 stop:4145 length:108 start_codon:yes stop_codon:yes gene_type:complete
MVHIIHRQFNLRLTPENLQKQVISFFASEAQQLEE